MMITDVIRTENLRKVYYRSSIGKKKEIEAVSDLNLVVDSGEIYGFLGPNGAGKSTTIKILMNLIFPTSGKAFLFGSPVSNPDVRARVGFLPENPYFYDYLTAEEFLKLNADISGVPSKEAKKRIEELLNFVGLAAFKKTRLKKFSKGMLQRIGLAQALINDPELVVLDEPTSGLDPIGRKMVLDLIKSLGEQGKTVFFSTHILNDVESVCTRVGIIIKGKLRKDGEIDELLKKSDKYRVTLTGISEEELANFDTALSEGKLIIDGLDEEKLYELIELIKTRKSAEIIEITRPRKTLEELFLEEVEKVKREEGYEAD